MSDPDELIRRLQAETEAQRKHIEQAVQERHQQHALQKAEERQRSAAFKKLGYAFVNEAKDMMNRVADTVLKDMNGTITTTYPSEEIAMLAVANFTCKARGFSG